MDLMTTTQMFTGVKNWVLGKLSLIQDLIPSQASSSNQLADKAFVNSSIATATATFRGTYNVVSDLSLSYNATHVQIEAALATKMTALSITPDNNDYAFVQIPTDDATPTIIAKVEKYKFNGTDWGFEYELNNSGFTASQWAAINSGATLELIGKLSALPTNAELTTLLDAKAAKSEMSITAGTGADADKATIQLKSGLAATVLTAHQTIQIEPVANAATLNNIMLMFDLPKSQNSFYTTDNNKHYFYVQPPASENIDSAGKFADWLAGGSPYHLSVTTSDSTVTFTYNGSNTFVINADNDPMLEVTCTKIDDNVYQCEVVAVSSSGPAAWESFEIV